MATIIYSCQLSRNVRSCPVSRTEDDIHQQCLGKPNRCYLLLKVSFATAIARRVWRLFSVSLLSYFVELLLSYALRASTHYPNVGMRITPFLLGKRLETRPWHHHMALTATYVYSTESVLLWWLWSLIAVTAVQTFDTELQELAIATYVYLYTQKWQVNC